MRNIKLTIQYDGTNYHGWQVQENAVTVQEVMENALKRLTGVKPRISGCGRTDTGVHAMNYICSFKTESNIPCDRFPYAINRFLPADVVCKRAEDMASEFDAHRSAVGKTYSYLILNSQYPDAFYHNRAWHYRYDLDVEKMKKAGEYFCGTHDFIGFAASGFTVKTTVRTIHSVKISKNENIIKIDVCGNGFLYNMVRIIAGTLVFAGNGKINAEDIPDIIESKDRKRAGITAPACGLYLSEVYY
ncbi:MAG: tRNA pseudouridine(38-40) synthase TruA [Clostridia bacterium]|nr:tRNA pseudouridine(38-40) synthase TruA [Clostridia bacterium]